MIYEFNADLGGQPGHGPVTPEPEGEFWHVNKSYGWWTLRMIASLFRQPARFPVWQGKPGLLQSSSR